MSYDVDIERPLRISKAWMEAVKKIPTKAVTDSTFMLFVGKIADVPGLSWWYLPLPTVALVLALLSPIGIFYVVMGWERLVR